ncbi:hypothetical protein EXIGLDRAFT_778264 [Exidia glandulosa HHB12029]|uniref:Uncharacterized protein n=1 Tax=Exidia glandulosa HHB12029 TaxID=1314781 RepID=A0A165CLY0_EXIGL|nr:hypothetical protein EXIGLDRAFT_778264 [Exidia glandulosa HHB12029]
MVPTRTTVSGVARNRLITSFVMVPTVISIRTSLPVAQSSPKGIASWIIAVAVAVPVLLIFMVILLFIFIRRRKSKQRRVREAPGDLSAFTVTSPYYEDNAQYPVMSPGPNGSHMVAIAGSSLSTTVAGVPLPSASSGGFRNEKVAAFADQQRPPSVPHAPPNYQTALSRSPSENNSFYTTSMDSQTHLIRRPSQRRFDVQYTPVVEFLQYINELPGAKQRNLMQYAPTFTAQDYYTIDDLRDVSQPELCEAIPGLTRGNGDYICQMVRAELLRIEGLDEQSHSQSQSQSQRSNSVSTHVRSPGPGYF